MLKFIPFLLLFFASCSTTFSRYEKRQMTKRWGEDINAFKELNKGVQSKDAILFYGSSSIRLWDSIEVDMAPYVAIRRGYGGASLHDAAYFARRVLSPIDYRALVLFVGNDIWGNEYDKTPEQMVSLTNEIVRTSRRHQPTAPVFIIEVTHIPAREALIDKLDAANAQLKAYADAREYVHFIPTRDLYLTSNDKVRKELFRADNIHQNEAGYAIWKTRIKEHIDLVLE